MEACVTNIIVVDANFLTSWRRYNNEGRSVGKVSGYWGMELGRAGGGAQVT